MNSTPQTQLNHSLLRPCILHVLRAAGYQATRPSVLDTLTDLAARYMFILAQSAAAHAVDDGEIEISIQDVRLAMQENGALLPEKTIEDQVFNPDEPEDTRGVDAFIAWAMGPQAKEIRRIGLEGAEGSKMDYLSALKKTHGGGVADEDTRYANTVLGRPGEPRAIKIEGGEITSIKDWADRRRKMNLKAVSTVTSSRRPSSTLSSLGDSEMEEMEDSIMEDTMQPIINT
ncbi:hypothetical protein BJ878DRAFT_463124 [Calycina marina]|uniref:Bromodomain associated domain-containing protein n=1 Tax=Calycina marina TaxID=1763456 RepID=A0A9P8CDH4_9HELO|nr:hypothetical protein BJ878DRAFT_463124 [Calycina marina]